MRLAGEIRSPHVAVTLVVHEHKRLGRGIELAMLAEELKAGDVGLKFLTRDLTGHESARKRGKTTGGAGVTDNDMPSMALHFRNQEMSLRDIAKRLAITTGTKKGRHPSPATVIQMLREHDEQMATAMST
ncbi:MULTISPECIES: hypothetical protein [unclassified Streptomyces]|uniref:hypothetical protein n=1 Tax=unclassified Streptomyces TaxID=2593676 RepID=UPI0038225C36